jgi:hypothetical protein
MEGYEAAQQEMACSQLQTVSDSDSEPEKEELEEA